MHNIIDRRVGSKQASKADILGRISKTIFCKERSIVNIIIIILHNFVNIVNCLLNFNLIPFQDPVSIIYPVSKPLT